MGVLALRQRLKEIGEKLFEDLCFQILNAKYPEAQIKKVDGTGGDRGVDLFVGQLSTGPAIWQCKFFANGIRDVQKKQIKKSLKIVLQNFTPKSWALCIPIDLSTSGHSWFQELQRENSGRTQIELLDAASIITELIWHREICETFFPDAIEINSVKAIKAHLLGTNELDDAQLSTITDETAAQFSQRLRDNDSRFDYEISYPVGDQDRPFSRGKLANPGLVMSMFDGKKRIDVIARDKEALRLDPPRMRIGFSPESLPKLERLLKKGTTEQFGPSEFTIAKNSFDYLLPGKAAPEGLTVRQTPTDAIFPFRITATYERERIRFNNVRFARIRGGAEEVELKSAAIDIGLTFRLVLNADGSGETEMVLDLVGLEADAAAKVLHFERLLRQGGTLEIVDLDRGATLMHGALSFSGPAVDSALADAVATLSSISERIGVAFRIPPQLSQADWQNLDFVQQVLEKGFGPAEINDLSADIMRDQESTSEVLAALKGGVIITLPCTQDPVIPLLGRQISLGSATAIVVKPKVKNFEQFAATYRSAMPGAVLRVEFETTSDSQLWFHRYMKQGIDPPIPIATENKTHRQS